MLQDIEPYQFNNEFRDKAPKESDYVVVFNEEGVLFENVFEQFQFPTLAQLSGIVPDIKDSLIYLFSVDDSAFYYSKQVIGPTPNLSYKNIRDLRELMPKLLVFIASTAKHLADWYKDNQYCGRCATTLVQSKTERALCCDKCGLIKYPNISPAIIVGIIDKNKDSNKDRILLTRYANREYKKWALVAGFTEIGENLENTVKREVMEEVGLRVKNITYFKSQPWSFSQSILMGFFAELDGNPEVKVDANELSEAIWFLREEIEAPDSDISLTSEMIEAFRNGKIPVIN